MHGKPRWEELPAEAISDIPHVVNFPTLTRPCVCVCVFVCVCVCVCCVCEREGARERESERERERGKAPYQIGGSKRGRSSEMLVLRSCTGVPRS